jgi:hypothetical protein
MATASETITDGLDKTADALVGRLFEATIGMMDVMSVYVRDRLGLY